MSFLFVWQTSIQAPLVVASAAIGFAQYFSYLVELSFWQEKMISGGAVILVFLLLYRKIEAVGRISVFFGCIVILTILWIIISGLSHHAHPIHLLPGSGHLFSDGNFIHGLRDGSVQTIYAFLGYYNVCHLGKEIKNPGKNIPRSIFISIAGIAVLYLLMNISVMGVLPWQSIRADNKFLVSSFMEQLSGHTAGVAITVLILCIALSSLFAVVLGYSRVPYAAAVDGNFFRIFSRLHPSKEFPYVSLIVLCCAGFLFSLIFKLGDVIRAILAMRILVQFIGQAVGVVILRQKFGSRNLPFKMWLFPLPVILSISVWAFLLMATGWFAVYGSLMALAGLVVFFIKENWLRRRPLASSGADT